MKTLIVTIALDHSRAVRILIVTRRLVSAIYQNSTLKFPPLSACQDDQVLPYRYRVCQKRCSRSDLVRKHELLQEQRQDYSDWVSLKQASIDHEVASYSFVLLRQGVQSRLANHTHSGPHDYWM